MLAQSEEFVIGLKNVFKLEDVLSHVTIADLMPPFAMAASLSLSLFLYLFLFFFFLRDMAFIITSLPLSELMILVLSCLCSRVWVSLSTLATLVLIPGMSPKAWLLQTNPAISTSFSSSTKLKHHHAYKRLMLSLLLLVSWPGTTLLVEYSCSASTLTFLSMIPFVWAAHLKGLTFRTMPGMCFYVCLSVFDLARDFWEVKEERKGEKKESKEEKEKERK